MATKNKWENHIRVTNLDRKDAKTEEKHEKFSPEMQKRRRDRSDKPFIPREYSFNYEATKDGIMHFVQGFGDGNPLFNDEAYAKKSRYGTLVAPGSYVHTVRWCVPGSMGAGVHGWYVGGEFEWYRPILKGDEFTPICVLRELVEKKGKMGGGKTWLDYSDVIYVNQRGEIVGKELGHIVMAERDASGSAKKWMGVPKPVYSKEDWMEILDLYENEEVRGDTPRYWEDVKEGDKVGPMIKGPLSVRDEIAWLMGAGAPFMKAHKLQYQYEARHPKLLEYVDTEEADTPGDVPELVHILNKYAQAIGIERAYDYGSQRQAWLCNLFTNWMGDDGFLWKMNGDLRAFNLVGDITRFEGVVKKKYVENGRHCVDIEAWAKNQRDEWSIPPQISTVLLPSKEKGPVEFPDPAESLKKEVEKARPLDDLIKEGLI